MMDGVAVGQVQFNENIPLRDGVPLHVRLADGTMQEIASPVDNSVPGAIAIQKVVEDTKWVSRSGDPVAYAPYLLKSPLAGVQAKSIVFQFAKADQSAPNPNTTAILRAGDLAGRATFYRHDLAYREISGLPKNPHLFMIGIYLDTFRDIALAAQQQIARFLESDGLVVVHPDPARYFEVPIQGPLPESLDFIT
jgi:hypothetical protein